jgi:hypothetical protein
LLGEERVETEDDEAAAEEILAVEQGTGHTDKKEPAQAEEASKKSEL